ncbi:NAD(P)/FAD-dependent oxidoreductase [Methyloraptor flagellatus]|uniref:NAD(P)/FAD-dependent oxidoreductase n=1 Tax=Methyloraptor flagellatus TaxID=3162530 RepID=A0AAU7XCN6_9HYPH
MSDIVDAVVVGAGVVGLAIARKLAQSGREVILLEREDAFGTATSSRNSEVIHAGIYYPADSLMARLCVAGKHALYAFCESHGVAHQRSGKLIVATDEAEAAKLDGIAARAARNGVADMVKLSGAEAMAMEPALKATAALLSPSTGIIDSHGYMLALLGDAEAAGAMAAFNAPLAAARATAEGFVLAVGGAEPMELTTRTLINAAGLHATDVARTIEGLDPATVPTAYYARGVYFTLTGRTPFSRLIYPVPVPGGLGTHLTLDLAGRARFGPDVEWIDRIDYTVDPARGIGFYGAIRRYWPDLPDGALEPAYAGVRPKIVPPAVASQDFRIDGPSVHGVPGLVNLFGIESPGLTSSLAIADLVAERVGG